MLKVSPLLIASAVCMGVFSMASYAAVTSNSMTLQWQGTVPTKPTVGGSWSFVSSINPSQSFNPSMGGISITDAANGKGKTISITPVSFSIKGNNGLTASSAVKAYLASPVSFTGLTPSSAAGTTAAPTLDISVGSKALSVGSASAVDVGTAAATPAADSMVDVNITGSGELKEHTFSEGDTFIVSASIVFTADAV